MKSDTTLFGLDPKAKPDERLIFGYIQNKNRALSEGFEKVKDYGQIQIFHKGENFVYDRRQLGNCAP